MLALAIAILATVLLTPFANAQVDSYTVLASVVFLRTGDRTPRVLGTVPSTLTSLGAQQAYDAGSFLRDRYVSSTSSRSGMDKAPLRGLSAMSIDPRQFYALALDSQPTIASAQAFIQGFYPPLQLNESTASLLDPTSVLANGTYIESPLNGYQYAQIRTTNELDPEFIYMSGSSECPAFQLAAFQYAASPEYQEIQGSSKSLYERVGAEALSDVLSEGSWDYANAYSIYDYLGYEAEHNATTAAALESTSGDSNPNNITDLDRLRFLADSQQYALYGNMSAYNNLSTPSNGLPGNTDGSISTIAGNMLIAKVMTQLQLAIDTRGRYFKLSLLAGDFHPLLSFFALTGLSDLNGPKFRSIPEFASTAVFELFTHDASASFPSSTDDLWVRFYFRNGTEEQRDQTPFQSYPLFNHGPSETDMRWQDFQAEAARLSLGSVGEWCEACQASTVFCPAFNASLFSAAAEAADGGAASGGKPISPGVAGVLGAVVALIIAALFSAMAMLLGGVRLHRKKKAAAGGGFQGDAKMPADRDVEVRGNDHKAGATVVGREASVDEGRVGGPVAGGHERVGSWEMKQPGSGGLGAAASQRSRLSFEGDVDEDDRRAMDPFADPVKVHERV